MSLELQIFLLSFTTLLVILAIISARSSYTAEAKRHEPCHRPKVVTLGVIQSVIKGIEFIFSRNVPSYEIAARINKECGDAFILKHPFKRQVSLLIADISVAKPIMNSSVWANKLPPDHYFHGFFDGKATGLLFGSGGYWRQGRKLVLRLFHQLGLLREETMEKIVQFEARELLEKEFFREIKEQGGQAAVLPMHHMFQSYALNIVWQVVIGRRFQRKDTNVQSILSVINAFNENFNVGASLLDSFPWLRHVPFLRFHKEMDDYNRFFKQYFQKEVIEPRRSSASYKTNPVDFVDHFLLEIDKRAGQRPCYVNDLNFVACMRDLLVAAMETTNSTLEHSILQICLQPGIQRKIQEEIERVIGITREPCYEDRKRMPYTQAVLYETLRYSPPVALVSRCPLRDEVIEGQYEVPKDSICGINLFAMHHSSEVWRDPEVFRPERFLNERNELINLDKLMPFGFGKRACIGEFVAKINMFIVFVSLLQKFTFGLSKKHDPPCPKKKFGLSHGPLPYYVRVTVRKADCPQTE